MNPLTKEQVEELEQSLVKCKSNTVQIRFSKAKAIELLRGYRAYLAMRQIEVDGGELPERVYIKLPCWGMTVKCTLGEAFDNAQRLAALQAELKGEG